MDFEKLLRPYKEGGRQGNPTERTMETMIDYLLNKKQFSMEIAGGGVFLIFAWLNKGGVFKGDGSYGSAGREMISSIVAKCSELQKERQTSSTWEAFLVLYAKHFELAIDKKQKKNFVAQGVTLTVLTVLFALVVTNYVFAFWY